MSVTSVLFKKSYNGRGDTGPYAIDFPVRYDSLGNADDIKVYLRNSDDIQSEITDDCTITGLNVYTTETYDATYKVILVRDPELKQSSVYTSHAKQYENDLDYLMYCIQKLQEQVNRSLRVPLSDIIEDLEFPIDTERAGRTFGFDDTGAIQMLATPDSAVTVSAFMETLLDDLSASAALTTLGLSAFVQTLIDDADAATFLATLGLTATAAEINREADASANNATKTADYTITDTDGLATIFVEPPAAAVTGTATTDTADKLVDSGGGFSGNVSARYMVENTTDGALAMITAVDSDTALSLNWDAFPDGNEDYEIYPFVTITLPTAADNAGRKLRIIKSGSNYGFVVIDGEGAETINGFAEIELWNQYQNIDIISDGSNWLRIDEPKQHLVADPGTGKFAEKTSWSGTNNFSSHGWTVDFSSVVPKGTKAVQVVIYTTNTSQFVSWRAYGNTNISNTPTSDGEWSRRFRGENETHLTDLWLSDDYKVEFTASNVGTYIDVSYPIAYLL